MGILMFRIIIFSLIFLEIHTTMGSEYYANLSPLKNDVTSFNEHYVVEWENEKNAKDYKMEGKKHTILLTIKEFFIQNPDFFDISPLQQEKFKNILICRVALFPNEEEAFQSVNLCFDPHVDKEAEQLTLKNKEIRRNSMNYGPFVISWDGTDEYAYQVASYAIWITSGICILICVAYFIKIGCEKCCQKKESRVKSAYTAV